VEEETAAGSVAPTEEGTPECKAGEKVYPTVSRGLGREGVGDGQGMSAGIQIGEFLSLTCSSLRKLIDLPRNRDSRQVCSWHPVQLPPACHFPLASRRIFVRSRSRSLSHHELTRHHTASPLSLSTSPLKRNLLSSPRPISPAVHPPPPRSAKKSRAATAEEQLQQRPRRRSSPPRALAVWRFSRRSMSRA
jgi:hypothetical protein